jgi:plastocyanin
MRRISITLTLLSTGAAVLLAAGPASAGGACAEAAATEGTGATVHMRGSCFTPTVLRAPSEATVTWVNDDPVPHTVTGVGDWSDRHHEIGPGEELSITFAGDGIYVYSCLVHPGMAGVVVIGDAAGPGAAEGTTEIGPAQTPDDATDAAPVPAPTGTSLPIVGTAVGLVGAGLGFGLGRRRRRATG